MLATGHVELAIRIFDFTQPSSFAVFNRVLEDEKEITKKNLTSAAGRKVEVANPGPLTE